ncbi:MAG: hypothetical protein GX199_03275 [Firmicutes bacterium]|nr:hypothetical protein [Bacillota bacterium]
MELNDTQVDLLISILVRFPCIGTIHCEPETETLRLVFLLRDAEQNYEAFVQRFQAHLSFFHGLKGRKVKVSSVTRKESAKLTVLEVVRDLASISLAELKLIVELVRGHYGESLIQDGPEVREDDALEHEMLIEALLKEYSEFGSERLTGFRDNGRVLVFSSVLGVESK